MFLQYTYVTIDYHNTRCKMNYESPNKRQLATLVMKRRTKYHSASKEYFLLTVSLFCLAPILFPPNTENVAWNDAQLRLRVIVRFLPFLHLGLVASR